MFQKKTVIVVGAGASSEANLPVGHELTGQIAGILDIQCRGAQQAHGDVLVMAAIKAAVQRDDSSDGDIKPYLRACWRIRDAMPQAISIDSFIDAHRGDYALELCGKLATARAILQAERGSLLSIEPIRGRGGIAFTQLKDTWFTAFMQLLVENCRVEELSDRLSSICMIVFNYDRCIEHFVVNAIQNYYSIDSEQAGELVRNIEIYHPYGSVGALPWYAEEHAIAFGAEPTASQLADLAGQIKTFTEGTDPDSSDIMAIRKRVSEASIILFLGFAYHRQNLDLICSYRDFPLPSPRTAVCFGSAIGISRSDCLAITRELVNLVPCRKRDIALRSDLNCAALFHEFWRSLSLS